MSDLFDSFAEVIACGNCCAFIYGAIKSLVEMRLLYYVVNSEHAVGAVVLFDR